MLLQLQQYDIEVIHVSGKNIPLAETLSRNFVSDTYPDLTECLDLHIYTFINSLPISDMKFKQIRLATQTNSQLQTLKITILDGRPDLRNDCPKTVLEFWNHRDELSVGNDVILRGQNIVIPEDMRQTMINAVHIGHMGFNKTLVRRM
jgi:hypothetical protein